jgi:hypothetical protein
MSDEPQSMLARRFAKKMAATCEKTMEFLILPFPLDPDPLLLSRGSIVPSTCAPPNSSLRPGLGSGFGVNGFKGNSRVSPNLWDPVIQPGFVNSRSAPFPTVIIPPPIRNRMKSASHKMACTNVCRGCCQTRGRTSLTSQFGFSFSKIILAVGH